MSSGCFVVLGCAVGLGCGVAWGDVPHDWLAAVTGNWSDPANWAGGDVPDVSNECAVFGLVGAYGVADSATRTFGGYRVTNPAVTLIVSGATHNIFGDVVNRGSIMLRGAGLEFGFADRRIDGDGVITLGSPGTTGRIDSDDATLTHGAGHTIEGNGLLEGFLGGQWVNEGIITANDPGGPGIELDAVMTQQGDGRIGADGGTLLLQNGSSITGGTLFNENGGKVKVDGPYVLNGIVATLNGVQVTGRVDVEDSYKVLAIAGSISNQGVIVVNGNLDADDAEVRFDADATIFGSGEVILRSNGGQAGWLTTATGVAGVIGESMTVRGAGIIEGNADIAGAGGIVNNGQILAEDPANALLLLGDLSGSGLYGANNATISLGDLVRLEGCRLDTQGSGRVLVGQRATLLGGENLGLMEIGQSGDLLIDGSLVNDGVITTVGELVLAPVLLRDGAVVSGSGSMEFDSTLEGIDSSSGSATIGAGQRIRGKCTLEGSLTIGGVLEPEGRIEILGDVTLLPSGVVRVQVGDRLSSDEDMLDTVFQGTIQLAGTLVVEADAGFVPVAGDSWTVVRGEPGVELLGAFDTVVLPDPPAGLAYSLETVTLGLVVSVDEASCPADLAAPFGVLNFFDLAAYIGLYNAGDPSADLAAPFGSLNFFDVAAYIGLYNAGCP